MSSNKYNGWANRETWLFNVYYGDNIESLEDYHSQKSLCYQEYYTVKDTIKFYGGGMFSDMLDIEVIDWNDLLAHYQSDFKKDEDEIR